MAKTENERVDKRTRFMWVCNDSELEVVKHIAADRHSTAASVLSDALIVFLKSNLKKYPEWKEYIDTIKK